MTKFAIILIIAAVSIIAILLLANLYTLNQPTGKFVQSQLSNDEIINKIKIFPEVSQYSTMPATVRFISSDELKFLSRQYPVVYGDVSQSVYEVRFSSGNSGLLVLYDADSNKVLKTFQIVGVTVS